MAPSPDENPDSGSDMLMEALQVLFRRMLSENLDALRESGELPGADQFRETVREEIHAVVDEKLAALTDSEKILEDIEKKLELFKNELDDVEKGEEQIQQKFAVLFEGDAFRSAVESIVGDQGPSGGGEGVDEEKVNAMVQEVVTESTEALEEKLLGAIEAKASQAGGAPADLSETIANIAGSTTEKILAREAEGLVRQIKIEIGKIRNDMSKNWEKTVALVKSPEFKKQIENVAGKLIDTKVGKTQAAGPSEDKVRDLVEEISTGIAEEVAQESLKGFLDELRNRVEAGIDTRLNDFMGSDDLKSAVASIAREAIPAGGGEGGGEGGGADIESVKKIVGEEIVRRTDEAFQDLIPRHVGKFLDDKLPPPEFFQSLATMVQVKQEIEKRMGGSKSGSGARAFTGPGGPGESAIFSNMIGRLLGSDELKEMIDDKFRVINGYIKSELIPKTVKKMLKDGQI